MASGESETLLFKKRAFFSDFAIRHLREMRVLKEGGVLGRGNREWRNVSEHCLLAGVMANTLGELLQISPEDLDMVTRVALIHDWDKRVEKETAINGETSYQGDIVYVSYDVEAVSKHEAAKNGLVRVTGDDWADFDQWGFKEKVLRYVDSSIGPAAGKNAEILSWRDRIAELKRRNSAYDLEVGSRTYGMPLYDKLAEITEAIEQELYIRIINLYPNLADFYPTPDNLTDLIRDTIERKIASQI